MKSNENSFWNFYHCPNGRAKRGVNFITFQTIKQKTTAGDICLWADIVDSFLIKEMDADSGLAFYCFAA